MTICIFGGTFDPPHAGHIHACKEFIKNFFVDKVYVIPTFIPPHKIRSSSVSASDRYEMCKIAFLPLSDKIEISDVEMMREGRSFTSDTIEYFKSMGNDKIYLLIGTDMFLTLNQWHECEYIVSNATLVWLRRESDSELGRQIEEKKKQYTEKYNANISFIESQAIELSSSEIRENLEEIKQKGLIADEVYDFIKKNRLYGKE